jgi:hypothetical protein
MAQVRIISDKSFVFTRYYFLKYITPFLNTKNMRQKKSEEL